MEHWKALLESSWLAPVLLSVGGKPQVNWIAIAQTLIVTGVVAGVTTYATTKVLEERLDGYSKLVSSELNSTNMRVDSIERTIDRLHPRTQ